MTRRIVFTLAMLACVGLCGRAVAQHAEGPESTKAETTHAAGAHAGGDAHGGHKTYELLPDPKDPQTWWAAV